MLLARELAGGDCQGRDSRVRDRRFAGVGRVSKPVRGERTRHDVRGSGHGNGDVRDCGSRERLLWGYDRNGQRAAAAIFDAKENVLAGGELVAASVSGSVRDCDAIDVNRLRG